MDINADKFKINIPKKHNDPIWDKVKEIAKKHTYNSELDALSDMLKFWMDGYEKLQADNKQQAERIAELEGALKEYGRHRESCSLIKRTSHDCDCGLEQAHDRRRSE